MMISEVGSKELLTGTREMTISRSINAQRNGIGGDTEDNVTEEPSGQWLAFIFFRNFLLGSEIFS